MAEGKRYYWLRLHDDFFSSKRIKKLRRLAGGDTYTIIYLKMQLLAIKSDGILKYTGLEKTFAEELALDLDEEVENVEVTLSYLASCGLIETSDNISYLLPYAVENTGSEGSSAKRVRDFRDKQKALHCNADVTEVKQNCNGEKEIEKEIKIEIEKEIKKEPRKTKAQKNIDLLSSIGDIQPLFGFSDSFLEVIQEWLKYKGERGDVYQETGLRNLLSQLSKKCQEYGEGAVEDVIRDSMSNQWKGIIFDKLEKRKAPQNSHEAYMEKWRNA